MNFEHLVIVNEPSNPLIQNLSREDLWFGLLCRVEEPSLFLPGLERCTILSRAETSLARELHFGQAVIRDRVRLVPMSSVTFESDRTDEHAGGSLTISIEEPEPNALMLRFVYRTTLPDGEGADGRYAGFVRSAYHESDLDTVRVIRRLLADGERPDPH